MASQLDALQSRYERYSLRTAEDIILYFRQAHEEYPTNLINRIWLSLMGCMNEIMQNFGDNDYEIPHFKKKRLEQLNELPTTIEVLQPEVINLGQIL